MAHDKWLRHQLKAAKEEVARWPKWTRNIDVPCHMLLNNPAPKGSADDVVKAHGSADETGRHK